MDGIRGALWHLEKMLPLEASTVGASYSSPSQRTRLDLFTTPMCSDGIQGNKRKAPQPQRAGQPPAKHLPHWKMRDSQEGYNYDHEDMSSASHYFSQSGVARGSAVITSEMVTLYLNTNPQEQGIAIVGWAPLTS